MVLTRRKRFMILECLCFIILGVVIIANRSDNGPVELAKFETIYRKEKGMIAHYRLERREISFQDKNEKKVKIIYKDNESLQIDRGQMVLIRLAFGQRNHKVKIVNTPFDRDLNIYTGHKTGDYRLKMKKLFLSDLLIRAGDHLDQFEYKTLSSHTEMGPMTCKKSNRLMKCQFSVLLSQKNRGPAQAI